VFHSTPRSSTPMATAVVAIATRFVIRPMTSAARARSTTESPSPTPKGRLVTPAVRTTEANDNTVAIVQTWTSRRRTGTPSRAARSARSALARTAIPVSVVRSRTASATMRSGATITANRSLASKTTPPNSPDHSNGAGSVRMPGPSPQSCGRSSDANASTWARPIVATVSSSRGAPKNRRTTSTSARTPTTTAAPSPAVIPTTHGSPPSTTSSTASVAGSTPRSPCAKLMTRFARQTRARPRAPRAPRRPRTAPEATAPIGMGNAICWRSRISTAGSSVVPARRQRSATPPDLAAPAVTFPLLPSTSPARPAPGREELPRRLAPCGPAHYRR
jgi:hypothetical protein